MSEHSIYRTLSNHIEQGHFCLLETTIIENSGSTDTDMKRQVTDISTTYWERFGDLAAVTAIKAGDTTILQEPVFPGERLIVLGGGHVAKPVCEFAAKVGFQVTVCDDRLEFANQKRFPLAEQVICDTFPNAIKRLRVTPADYVVIVTRGHRYDADCLRVLLAGTMPAYLGMIGSRHRVKGLLELLAEEGFSLEALNRICTPIGLSIGAVTPEEIAISIMAEVIAYRRLPQHQKGQGRCSNQSDVDLEVIRYLANNTEPKAIVTVMETKGSTPRAAGAKMAVSPLGRVTGSIGGGCSESAVIREAIRLIGTGTYKVYEIDMTDDVAESEGMVCGGIMRVLIEDFEGS